MKPNTENQLSVLTDIYDRLIATEKAINNASKQIENTFAELDDDGWFSNTVTYRVSVVDTIESARASFTDFVVKQLNDDYKNLTIDRDAMNEYTKTHGFNADALINHIKEKYANEDDATLQQIKSAGKELIPYRSGRRIKTPDDLNRLGNAGFELRTYGYNYGQRTQTETFLKLVDITLRDIRPSEVDTKSVEIGKVYKDDKIKSLRYFKNNSLKVIFHTVDDCEKVKATLFEE